jgi:hypothetical protein
VSWLVLNHAVLNTKKVGPPVRWYVIHISTLFPVAAHARPSYEQVCCVFCFPLELLNKTVLGL